MTRDSRGVRAELVKVSRALHQRGWVANHDGNVTARLGPNRFLATPTSVSKADVSDEKLIIVDESGKRVSGSYRPFSELVLHLTAYRARSDVKAVVHAHPPFATAFAVAGRGLDRPILPEAVVSLGDRIPLVPLALPGSPDLGRDLEAALSRFDAILLENHGVVTVGSDLEQAYLRMELVEHLAKIEWHANQIGGAQYLTEAQTAPLLEKRVKAGLGPVARGVEAAPPSPSKRPRDIEELRRIVAEEIRSALKS